MAELRSRHRENLAMLDQMQRGMLPPVGPPCLQRLAGGSASAGGSADPGRGGTSEAAAPAKAKAPPLQPSPPPLDPEEALRWPSFSAAARLPGLGGALLDAPAPPSTASAAPLAAALAALAASAPPPPPKSGEVLPAAQASSSSSSSSAAVAPAPAPVAAAAASEAAPSPGDDRPALDALRADSFGAVGRALAAAAGGLEPLGLGEGRVPAASPYTPGAVSAALSGQGMGFPASSAAARSSLFGNRAIGGEASDSREDLFASIGRAVAGSGDFELGGPAWTG